VFYPLVKGISSIHGKHYLLYSDRGFQFTSHGFKGRVDQAGVTHNMSRVGRCIE
jgi:Integrase core domain.